MVIPIRYVLIVLFLLVALFLTFSIHNEYIATSLKHFAGSSYPSLTEHTPVQVLPNISQEVASEKANATFVVLCRNSDMDGTIQSIQSIEDRFNRYHGYPYVFLNEEPFDDMFKRRISVLSSAPMEFGLIPHDNWYTPDWIDEKKAAEGRQRMEADHVIYGGSISYRNMCRFNSGFFFRHQLLQKYRYYWRIEPWVRFHCDVPSDPFLFMQNNNKAYGFTISLYEFEKTIPTLWETVKQFVRLRPDAVHPDNALAFISDDGGSNYNLCHFWSNFEVGDLDFWRGELYMSYFEFLDQSGGFYYERWGDAPVHSIAASLFLPRSAIHFFDEIGYEHPPYTHCPLQMERWLNGRCSCNPDTSFDYDGYSCLRRWENL